MNRFSLLLSLLALCGMTLLGGCALGRSPRPNFYMLSSPAENAIQPGQSRITGPRIAVGPVTIPGYLDRPQLFLRTGNDVQVELAEFNHWSEPLAEGVTRVLCDAVTASLAPQNGMAFPMRSTQSVDRSISVDITRFDGAPNGIVTLDAGWSLLDAHGGEIRTGRFIRQASAGPDINSMVRAQSELLASFGAELGKMVK